MKITRMLAVAGAIALLLLPVNARAGEINENEQRIVSEVSQSFVYDGQTYVVKSEYVAEGKEKLAQDDVNLSASEAEDYIGQFHGSYQELVEEGYCERAEGRDSSQPAAAAQAQETEHSAAESRENRLFLRTILGDASDGGGQDNPDTGESRDDGSGMTGVSRKGDSKNGDRKQAAKTPAASPASAREETNEWAQEQELGEKLDFGDGDRKQAREKKLVISGFGGKYAIAAGSGYDGKGEDAGQGGNAEEGGSASLSRQENFLNRFLHIRAWKILFSLMAVFTVLSVAGTLWYIFKIKRHRRKRRRVRRWLAVFLGVSFGGWALLVLLMLGLYFGVYNSGALQRQMMESDYFLGVTQMTRELAGEELVQAGYEADAASEIFTLSSVYIEEKQYIENVLRGEKDAALSTERIHDSLEAELVKEDGTGDFVMIGRMEELYCRMLQFELGQAIRESREEFMPWFYAVCMTGSIFLAAIFVLAYKMYGYLHKSVRIAAASFLAASGFVTAVAVLVRLLRLPEKVEASPVYYQQFLQKYVAWDINVFLYIGCLGILIAAGMIIWKRYLHIMDAE